MPINDIFLQHSPELISRNSVMCFFLINKACEDILCILLGILKNLPQSENLVRGAATWAKTTLAIFQFWFHYFSAFPFKAFGIHFSWKAKKWYSLIIRTLFKIVFLVYKNDHTCLPVFRCFSKFPRPLTHSCQPTNSFSVQCLQCFRSNFVFVKRWVSMPTNHAFLCFIVYSHVCVEITQKDCRFCWPYCMESILNIIHRDLVFAHSNRGMHMQ